MHSSSVTAVIPTFNSSHYLQDAINSVLDQTVPLNAVIVIDDGSTDGTAELLAPYGRRITYVQQQNAGVSTARNVGIKLVSSEYVALLDADDVWHPRKIEIQLGLLRANPTLALLGTECFSWPSAVPTSFGSVSDRQPVCIPWEQIVVRNPLVTSSILVRRSVLELAGLFDPELQGMEDFDLWLRVAELGNVANLRLPLTGYRNSPGSLSKHARRMEAGNLRVMKKIKERGAWRGRLGLKLKAHSMIYHQASYMYGSAGSHATAIGRSLLSLMHFPWPYRSEERRTQLERPKWFVRSLLNLLVN